MIEEDEWGANMKLEEMVLLVDIRDNDNSLLKYIGTDTYGNIVGIKSYIWTGLYDSESREVYIGVRPISQAELDFISFNPFGEIAANGSVDENSVQEVIGGGVKESDAEEGTYMQGKEDNDGSDSS